MEEAQSLFMNFSAANFTTIGPFPHVTQMSIMPVVSQRAGVIASVGTCFAVSSQGLVLTARHVVEEILGEGWEDRSIPDDVAIGALYVSPAGFNDGSVEDVFGHDFGGFLPAVRISTQTGLDVALIQLNLPIHKKTGRPIRMPQLPIDPAFPPVGSDTYAVGYHKMSWIQADDTAAIPSVTQSYSGSRGEVSEIYFPRRDDRLLNFPSFQTNARYDGGMSGGPILGQHGVVGVVCSSYGEIDNGFLSFGSLIGPALSLQIETQTAGTTSQRFLHDFVTGGAIKLVHSLSYERQIDRLVLDFGNNRRIMTMLR